MSSSPSSLGPINSLLGPNSTAISYAAATIFALITLVYFYYRNLYGFFKRLGLKNPPVYPMLGNLPSLFLNDRFTLARDWARDYGKLYGVFHGIKKKYVIADADVLRQVCIKDFDKMPNHEKSVLLNDYQKHFIFFMQDAHWKRVRALQSPTFTSGKIKRMFKLLGKCCDDLIQCFEEQLDRNKRASSNSILNVKDIYSLYTLDCIASAAYSMKLNREGTSSIKAASSRDEFVQLASRVFETDYLRVLFALSTPRWLLQFFGFTMSPMSKLEGLAKKVRQMIESRKSTDKRFDDYLQILLDAKLDDKMELNEMDEKENHHAGLTSNSLLADQEKMLSDIKGASDDGTARNGVSHDSKNSNGNNGGLASTMMTPQESVKLSHDEIVSSAIFLLIVGLETTASLLTHCSYALAFHQDIQERLYQTIKGLAKHEEGANECTFEYESLTSSPYLDAVISETLRALSPVVELDRKVSQDCRIEKYNVTLKKGEVLLLSYHAIMNDPDYFPDPLRFDPDRFMPENRDKIVPGSYCPFGLGPRHCIGMRFSLTEAKLALARVLMRYKFVPAPGTVYPPPTTKTIGLSALALPVVEVQLR